MKKNRNYKTAKIAENKEMKMILIDCKKISENKIESIKNEIAEIESKTGLKPCLATILVGENPASAAYINAKIKKCAQAGIQSLHYKLAEDAKKEEIVSLIETLNASNEIDAVLLQLPLPKKEFEEDCINAINPLKDADGLCPYNAGLLSLAKNYKNLLDKNIPIPCTPLGIIHILKESGAEISGKNAVIIGRSNLVGKPLALLLLLNDASVICVHSKTKNLKEICKSADILIAAIGRPNFINKDYIKDGSIVIDVGINRIDGKITGDIDFEDMKNLDIKLTPVPGGVGVMTTTMLLENTLRLFKQNRLNKKSAGG
ncbi:MAG: bifunctional 5,10-methylenetetrahydrofolate dehydrogenase/5,10-methenyltetrahydrofolate cyclohydrolase [Elusimicrobiota bacterium]|nr:bifunctional 5,10-methylenetetrahydrofolate dehydrogenase/5,10-methenyltetrahydrofolate cyclohydrolase [Elusimicrobiota bacterium]